MSITVADFRNTLDIRVANTTFGLELEYADLDKFAITLPHGYKWADHDLIGMVNSDATPVTHKGRFGGEINTKPYHLLGNDLAHLRAFIDKTREADGYLIWNTGFDGHLYVKDLGLDVIKRVFELSYYVAPILKKVMKMPIWFENEYQSPTPTIEVVNRMNMVERIEDIPKMFENGSIRGHIRYYVNVVPTATLGTVEFRFLNSSWNWMETLETIKFMYSFVNYALLNTDTSKYRELNTKRKVLKAFNINPDLIPNYHPPLLWANEITNFTSNVATGGVKPSPVFKKAIKVISKFKHLHLVNSYYGDIEQVVNVNKITVYTKSIFISLMYRIILDDFVFKLIYPFDWLETHKGDKAERLAKLFLFVKIKKVSNEKNFYQNMLWADYKEKYDNYVKKGRVKALRILNALENKNITVVEGDINDAMDVCTTEHDLLVYQPEFIPYFVSIDRELQSNLGIQFEGDSTHYKQLDLNVCNYLVFSPNKYLPLEKIINLKRYALYSNVDTRALNIISKRVLTPVNYRRLADDHVITPESTISFIPARLSEINYLRMLYIKKGIHLGKAPFKYMVFLDDQLFGVLLFDYSKKSSGASEIVYMKSDFVVSSKHPKLSKLLIMLVLTTEFKSILDVVFRGDVRKIETTVFTNQPASMKYRGVFNKTGRMVGALQYVANAGRLGTVGEVLENYVKKYVK